MSEQLLFVVWREHQEPHHIGPVRTARDFCVGDPARPLEASGWGMDYCRRDRCTYFVSGGAVYGVGPGEHWWASPELAYEVRANETATRHADLPPELRLSELIRKVGEATEEDSNCLLRCDACNDWLPRSNLCPHFIRCEECGGFGPEVDVDNCDCGPEEGEDGE